MRAGAERVCPWAGRQVRKPGLRSVAAACLGQASRAVRLQWVAWWGGEGVEGGEQQWEGAGRGARAVAEQAGQSLIGGLSSTHSSAWIQCPTVTASTTACPAAWTCLASWRTAG